VGDAVGFEAAWCLEQIHKSMAGEDDHILATDVADRMDGRCDACQQWSEHGMTIDGGFALCDGCIGEESVSA